MTNTPPIPKEAPLTVKPVRLYGPDLKSAAAHFALGLLYFGAAAFCKLYAGGLGALKFLAKQIADKGA
jgi:hypothetical protein